MLQEYAPRKSLQIIRKKSLVSSSTAANDSLKDQPMDLTDGSCQLLEQIGTCSIFSMEQQVWTKKYNYIIYNIVFFPDPVMN